MATTPNTNTNWSTPDNVVSLQPLRPLSPSFFDSPTSGGTLGLLDYYRGLLPSAPAQLPLQSQSTSLPNSTSPPPHLPHPPKPSVDAQTMMLWLDGGKDKTKRRKFIQGPTRNGQFLHKYHLSRPETVTQHMSLFHTIHDKFITKMVPDRQDTAWMTQIATFTGSLTNHFGLGVNTILNAANDDQRDEWLPRGVQTKMIISYAQTELKHGSNVRGLHAVAEYDHGKQCFVVNTPSLGSIKWWPGCLGATATHAIVYANLIIPADGVLSTDDTMEDEIANNDKRSGKRTDDNTPVEHASKIPKEYGVHAFLVQVRDENHRPCLGIEIGDNGDCIGDYGNDTGFLRLTNVVIPKFNMLAKYQWIDDAGVYIKSTEKKENPQLHYLTMLQTRGGMISKQSGILSRAVTIAARYSFIRTQGFINPTLLSQVQNSPNSSNLSNSSVPHAMHPLEALERGLDDNISMVRLPHTVLPHIGRDSPIPLTLSPTPSHPFSFQSPEYPIIEYASHRNRILNHLALTYVLKSTSSYMISMLTDLSGGDSSAAGGVNIDLNVLHDIAPITAGLKALTTSMTHQSLLDLNQSLGGNGYLKSAGIAELWLTYSWETTAEGEKIPMLLQCARSLLKSMLDGSNETWNWGRNQGMKSGNDPGSSANLSETTGDGSKTTTKRPPLSSLLGSTISIEVTPTFLDHSPASTYLHTFAKFYSKQSPIFSRRGRPILPPPGPIMIAGDFTKVPIFDQNKQTGQNHSDSSSTSYGSSIHTDSRLTEAMTMLESDCNLYKVCFFALQSNLKLNSSYAATPLHNPLFHLFLTQNPLYLLYLLKLAQFRSISIWAQIFHLYHQQMLYLAFATRTKYQPWDSTAHLFASANSAQNTTSNLTSSSSSTTTTTTAVSTTSSTTTTTQSSSTTNTTSPGNPNFIPTALPLASQFELVFNSLGGILTQGAEEHCKFYMLSAFITQILRIYTNSPHFPPTHPYHVMAQCILSHDFDTLWKTATKYGFDDFSKSTHKTHQTSASTTSSHTDTANPPYHTLLPALFNLATIQCTTPYISSTPSLYNPQTSLISYKLLFHLHSVAANALINDVIPLCDAFDISDAVLCTTIGNYDGNPYESLFTEALNSENNQQSPFHTAGYDKWMKQRFDLDFLAEGKDEQAMLYHKVFTDKGDDVGAKL